MRAFLLLRPSCCGFDQLLLVLARGRG